MEGDENVFDSSPRRNLIPARAGTTTTMTTPPTKPKPTRASPGSGAAVGAKKMSNVPAVKSVHVGPLWTHWEEQLACSRADVDEMRTARDAATRAKDELAEKLRVALDALTTTRSENTELSERVAALELARADDARAMEALREEHATQTASTAERHATELSEGMDAKCKRKKSRARGVVPAHRRPFVLAGGGSTGGGSARGVRRPSGAESKGVAGSMKAPMGGGRRETRARRERKESPQGTTFTTPTRSWGPVW